MSRSSLDALNEVESLIAWARKEFMEGRSEEVKVRIEKMVPILNEALGKAEYEAKAKQWLEETSIDRVRQQGRRGGGPK